MNQVLVQKLTEETQDLKISFFQKTEQWCSNYYKILEDRSKWNEVDWCKYFGLEPEIHNKKHAAHLQFLGFPKGFYSTKNSKEYQNQRNIIRITLSNGFEKMKEKELQKAKLHYENSILKLADRLEKKGIDYNFEIVNKKLGVNFEMILKGRNGEVVKAFTIIAEGEIQRPHYRYLIK